MSFQFGLQVPLLLNLNAAYPFLQGPFLLMFVMTLVGMRQRLRPLDALHFLPFIGLVAFFAITQGLQTLSLLPVEKTLGVGMSSISTFFSGLLLVSVPFYIAWSLLIMRRANQALGGQPSSVRFRWIWGFIVSLAIVWMVPIVNQLLPGSTDAYPHLVFWALAIVVYVLGYLGLTKTTVFSESELAVLKEELRPKYARSGLTPQQSGKEWERLLGFIEENQPQFDGELSLSSLAGDLGMSNNY